MNKLLTKMIVDKIKFFLVPCLMVGHLRLIYIGAFTGTFGVLISGLVGLMLIFTFIMLYKRQRKSGTAYKEWKDSK
jgi:hypothetical protein